jgi:hypothetical protein
MCKFIFKAIIIAALSSFSSNVYAGEAADQARQILESGQLVEGEKTITDKLNKNPSDNELRFGLGLIRFTRAIERYAQSQYKYGLRPPKNTQIPFLRFPVPLNPNPEPLTYEAQRDVFKTLLADLEQVDLTLGSIGDAPVKIKLNLSNIKFDLRNDGKADESGRLASILSSLRMMDEPTQEKIEPFEVVFDTSDVYWLRGYTHLTSATLQFLLAYDWHVTFEQSGRLFYPKSTPTSFDEASQTIDTDKSRSFIGSNFEIADVIALLHEIRWPVAEPQRMKAAHTHFKQVISLGRLTWKSILAETDDDHEWIPNPTQKGGVLRGMPVGKEQVDEWLAALDDFDAILDGKILIPYWRFNKGLNFKKVFYEPRQFDMVLWFTGHAAVSFLEDGPIIASEIWFKRDRVFGGHFLSYAAWFN